VRFIETTFQLQPGPLATPRAREVLEAVWDFLALSPPFHHGDSGVWIPTPPHDPVRAIVDHFDARGSVWVFGSSWEEGPWISISPNPARSLDGSTGRRNTRGSVAWHVPIEVAQRDSWRDLHRGLMTQIAKILDSPYTVANTDDDDRAKTRRFIPGRGSLNEVSRIRGYHEGLVGLFWRNVFGPLFTDMIGARLRGLPTDVAQDLGDGYWFVQPYERPEQAGTDEAKRREAEVIDAIGREFFYDMTRERPAVRVPALPWQLDPEELDPRADIAAFEEPANKEHASVQNDKRYWVLYAAGSGFSVDKAAELLRAQSGFSIKREQDGFAARHGKGPVLHVGVADHTTAIATVSQRIKLAARQAQQLASTNACIQVAFDDLHEVLDEANTLIECQLKLQEATHGLLFMLWNNTLQEPDE